VDPCTIEGDLRRRLTLAPGAPVWGQVGEKTMEKARADLFTLKKKQGDELQKQCAKTSTTLKSINETLSNLSTWVDSDDKYFVYHAAASNLINSTPRL
jgi:hypothetical protein